MHETLAMPIKLGKQKTSKSAFLSTSTLIKTVLIAASIGVVSIEAAQAQSSLPTFTCTADPYVVINTPSQLQQLDVATGGITPLGTASIGINAIGYNIADDYIYGLSGTNFYRMGADASLENLGTPTGAGTFNPAAFAGVMDGSGNWYGVSRTEVFIVPIGDTPANGTLTFTSVSRSTTTRGADYAFSNVDNALYYNASNGVFRIDPVTGAGSQLSLTGDTIGRDSGGAWSTSDGTIYFYNNGSGLLHSVDVSQSPAVVTKIRNVATNRSFDGTACMPPSLTKTLLPTSNAVAGGTMVYEFVASNAFPSPITIDFDDTLATPHMTFDTSTLSPANPGGGTVNALTTTNINISDMSIPGGGSTVFQVIADISPTIPDGTSLTNAATATFGATVIDSAPPGGEGPTAATIDSNADLVTVKTLASSSPTPNEGDTVTFEITVTNNGAANTSNVSLTDALPAGLTATALNGTASVGTYDAATGLWSIGALVNGVSAVLTIEGTVDAGQGGNTITNTLTAPASGDQSDPSTSGDDLTESVKVEVPRPSLSITKVANGEGPHLAGDVVTYTYTVKNDGDQVIRGVTISDTHNGSDPAPTPSNETLLTDAAPTGDSTDAVVDESWDVLAPGDVLTFTGTYTITQTDAENL